MEDQTPPAALLRVVNPVLRTVLRSPLRGALGRGLMLLHVTGRKSGRVYVVPVGRHVHEGQLVASAGGAWRRNLAGGAALEVTLDGRRRPAHGELVDDPYEVAQIFGDLLSQLGWKRANRLGLKLNVDRAPTTSELQAALVDRRVVRLTLLDTAGPVGR
ncbi:MULTISPECIES: nitroreductase/quinone reductase family protein [unclassified Ornithinimicrobium]|uniref:nitroreductase/quinone reductase family protein n=1 Tax=unclassified Ornithinimicrobium TaxID=2615080 RepID=UPI0038518667